MREKIPDLRSIIQTELKDLSQPKAAIYWIDLFISSSAAKYFIWLCSESHFLSPATLFSYLAAVYFTTRAANFLHEVQHSARKIRGFTAIYDVLVGWHFGFPSYVYDLHHKHHNSNEYGTKADPELDTWGTPAPQSVAVPFWQELRRLPLTILRFAVLPLLYPVLSARFLEAVHKYASQNGSNPFFERDISNPKQRKKMYVHDICCAVIHLGLVLACVLGILPWSFLLYHYATIGGALMLTQMQTYAFHFFETGYQRSTFHQQLEDTCNYSHWYDELWAPLNSRHHLLHHLNPAIPYHSLGKAHKRLMKILPADHIYVKNQNSLWRRLSGKSTRSSRAETILHSKVS